MMGPLMYIMPKRLTNKQRLGLKILGAVCVVLLLVLVVHLTRYVLYSTAVPMYVLDKLNLRAYTLPDLTCDRCNNFTYRYLVENKSLCPPDEDIFLLTFVTSFHVNVGARDAMRRTWAGLKEYRGQKLRTMFVFGTHPDKNLNNQTIYEQKLHGDILQADFADHYRFLSNKTTAALRWITQNCPRAQYILKTDDDSFNVPQNFVDYLLSIGLSAGDRFVGGYCFTVMPDRRAGSKFHVSAGQYPDLYYPTYCAGPGYVLSQAAARDIVAVSDRTRFVPMEDVFVTGMCRVRAGIQYTEIAGVVVGPDQLTPCDLVTWVKNAHHVVPRRAEALWQQLNSTDRDLQCSSHSPYIYLVLLLFGIVWIRFLFGMYTREYKCKQ